MIKHKTTKYPTNDNAQIVFTIRLPNNHKTEMNRNNDTKFTQVLRLETISKQGSSQHQIHQNILTITKAEITENKHKPQDYS